MPTFEALYYPYFEPPDAWFRSYLMIYDTIWTVIPTDFHFEPSASFRQIVDLIPDSHRAISPNENDKELEGDIFNRLDKAFKMIRDEKNTLWGDETAIKYKDGEELLGVECSCEEILKALERSAIVTNGSSASEVEIPIGLQIFPEDAKNLDILSPSPTETQYNPIWHSTVVTSVKEEGKTKPFKMIPKGSRKVDDDSDDRESERIILNKEHRDGHLDGLLSSLGTRSVSCSLAKYLNRSPS